MTLEELIQYLDLKPHPEGGYFKETYRCMETLPSKALPKRFTGDRSISTGILFLLAKGQQSNLHKIKSDEMWHFYLGGPLTVVQISPKGRVDYLILGQDLKAGHKFQHVVPAGYWFGAYPNLGTDYSLVGCTVAPGFDFADFEMAQRLKLLKQFPTVKTVIERLTPAPVNRAESHGTRSVPRP